MALTSSAHQTPRRLRRSEEGYILLTLMLVVALMAIAATAVLSEVSFEIRRDREQEMIHRGVQYTRAIRAYYKKLGRYPTKLEDLDNTNNLRYLRKHYKDPENKNKDFKLLHFGDPDLSLGANFAGGIGASPAGSPAGLNGSGSNGSAFGGGSSFGGSSFGGSGSGAGFGGSGVNSQGVFAQSGPGGNSNGGFGGSSNNSGPSNTPGANQSDPSQTGASGSQDSSSSQSSSGSSNGQGGQVLGGGAIVGVASLCKDKTIRIYNKKSKYNEWQFIYDPTADRGGLITTPYQPLQNLGGGGIQGAQPAGGNGTGSAFSNSGSSFGNSGSSFGNSGNGSSFGNSGSSFGSSSGFGNSPGSNGPASPQTPSNPPNN